MSSLRRGKKTLISLSMSIEIATEINIFIMTLELGFASQMNKNIQIKWELDIFVLTLSQ